MRRVDYYSIYNGDYVVSIYQMNYKGANFYQVLGRDNRHNSETMSYYYSLKDARRAFDNVKQQMIKCVANNGDALFVTQEQLKELEA